MKRVKWLLLFSLILNVIGLVFFVIGFSTHFWLESDKNYRTSSGFESLGLWEACFKDFSHKTSYNGKQYNGCWWMFSYEYEPIREWLNPPWLVAIQVMMTVSLLLQLVGSIIGVLVFLGVCPGVANFLALLSISVMILPSHLSNYSVMAQKASKIVILSLIICSVGFIFFLLSFGTGNWLEPNANDKQGFLSLGLWEACFRNWRYYKDPTQNIYDGCRWMLSADFDAIREWIWPSWMQGVQGIMCVSLVLEISVVIVYVIVMFHMLRQKYVYITLLVTAGANFISAFFCAVSLIVFHTKALNDLRWIENNEKQNQGWSFFILIPAILCFIISGVTTVMAARRFRRDDSDGPVAIPYRS